MIMVTIERRVKSVSSILPFLRQLRAEALEAEGYINGFTMVGTDDKTLVTAMATWESAKHWKEWESSQNRAKLYKKIEPFLLEEPTVKVYRYLSYQKKS